MITSAFSFSTMSSITLEEGIEYIGQAVLEDYYKELEKQSLYTEKSDHPEDMSEEDIIKRVKADVAESNKGQPSYRKVQNVYVSFNEFEKNSTRKVIRQKVIDTYTKKETV